MATNLRQAVTRSQRRARGCYPPSVSTCACRPLASGLKSYVSSLTRYPSSRLLSSCANNEEIRKRGARNSRLTQLNGNAYDMYTLATSFSRYGWFSTVAAAADADASLLIATSTTPSTTSSLSNSSIDSLLQEAGIEREYLESLAKQHPTPLRLRDMYEYGTSTDSKQRLRNCQFLHKEIPVRLAQRSVDLLTLPHGLSEAVPIRQVASIYLNFLRRFKEFPYPVTVEQEGRFTDMLQTIVLNRSSVPVSIAQGVKTWWLKEQPGDEERLQEMEEALYRFFTARVGLRFLTEHFVLSSNRESAKALRKVTSIFPLSGSSEKDKVLGCIQSDVDVVKEIRRVADLVTHQTKEYYGGLCPVIDIIDCVSEHEFTHVPHHLHYMVSELLKNSCRASMRRYKEHQAAGETTAEIPSIRVIVVKGEEDVTIKIADKGGGIPRSLIATIWKFAHSTASEDELQAEFGTDVTSGARIRGFGLPLSRIYARYFGGELTLKSTEGYGLDAYLHLPRLGDCCENLPLRVRDSPGAGVSMPVPKTTLSTTMVTASPRGIRTYSTRHSSASKDDIASFSRMGALSLFSKEGRKETYSL